jgi:predicted GTPase
MNNLIYLKELEAAIVKVGGVLQTGVNWDWAIFPTEEICQQFLDEHASRVFGLSDNVKPLYLKDGSGWAFRAR